MKIILTAVIASVSVLVAVMAWRSAGRKSMAGVPLTGAALSTLDEVAAWLAANAGATPRRYSTFDFGRQQDTSNISLVLSEKRAQKLLPNLRSRLGDGLVAFIGTTRWLGEERHPGVELVVARGQTQFDILRAARSDAVNHCMETEDLISQLQDLHKRVGIDIFQAEADTVQFEFLNAPKEPEKMAEELYELCPDIVDQGCGSVNALARGLRESRLVLLWWD